MGERQDVSYDIEELFLSFAQKLPYPVFDQAVNSQPTSTSHPEATDITAIGSTPETQQLNLTQLPEALDRALNDNSNLRDRFKFVCIDCNKLHDNHCIDIYDKLLDHGYPKETPPPDNFSSLNLYCSELKRESDYPRKPVLIFYHSQCLSEGQDLPTSLLDALSTFDDSTPICAITHQEINRPLKTLVPNDPDLDLVSAIALRAGGMATGKCVKRDQTIRIKRD